MKERIYFYTIAVTSLLYVYSCSVSSSVTTSGSSTTVAGSSRGGEKRPAQGVPPTSGGESANIDTNNISPSPVVVSTSPVSNVTPTTNNTATVTTAPAPETAMRAPTPVNQPTIAAMGETAAEASNSRGSSKSTASAALPATGAIGSEKGAKTKLNEPENSVVATQPSNETGTASAATSGVSKSSAATMAAARAVAAQPSTTTANVSFESASSKKEGAPSVKRPPVPYLQSSAKPEKVRRVYAASPSVAESLGMAVKEQAAGNTVKQESSSSSNQQAAAKPSAAAASENGPNCMLLTRQSPRGGKVDVRGSGFGNTPVVRIANRVSKILRRGVSEISVQVPSDSDGGDVSVMAGGVTSVCGQLTIIGKDR